MSLDSCTCVYAVYIYIYETRDYKLLIISCMNCDPQ